MTTDAAIRVQGLEKSFKKLHVLRSVTFDVARGNDRLAATGWPRWWTA
jgi:ABC-2 type transport system ATP-binding protein